MLSVNSASIQNVVCRVYRDDPGVLVVDLVVINSVVVMQPKIL